MSFLPEFFKQCCDAGSYLEIGSKCALENDCYDETRPGGVGYWFSIPTRLGLSDNVLIYTNIALLLLSMLFFCLAILAAIPQKKSAIFKIVLGTAALIIHAVFLWPTLFTSLSDSPSALLLLNGIWILLLTRNTNNLFNIVLIITGSCLIGMATWIRSFYFYPLLASLAVTCIGFVFFSRASEQASKRLSHLLIFCALFFPAIQIMHTYKVSQKLAYMNTNESNAWTEIHLNSKEVGYDTVIPTLPMYSNSQYCNINNGLLPSLKEGDYSSLACLFFNRSLFFLSTYKKTTYIEEYNPTNKLSSDDIENIGKSSSWLANNINIQWDSANDPIGGTSADTMVRDRDDAYLVQWAFLPANTEYSFSVWLWSEHPGNIEIAFSHHGSNTLISKKIIPVTPIPQRVFVSGKTSDANDYSVSIGNMPFANTTRINLPLPSSFYAWGAQLEVGSTMTAYAGIEKPDPELLRPKSLLLLVANLAAIFAACCFVIRNRKTLITNSTHLAAISLIVFSCAEALTIIPEQRFIIVPMIFIWLLAATQAASFVDAKLCRFQTPN